MPLNAGELPDAHGWAESDALPLQVAVKLKCYSPSKEWITSLAFLANGAILYVHKLAYVDNRSMAVEES